MNPSTRFAWLWRLFFGLVGLVAPALLVHQIYTQTHLPGIDFSVEATTGRVLAVKQGSFGNISGFMPGDIILNVDGIPFAQWPVGPIGVHFAQVQRHGETLRLELVVISYAHLNWLNLGIASLIVLAYWGSSLLLLLRRFEQQEVRLLFLASQVTALALLFPLSNPAEDLNPAWAVNLSIGGVCLAAALILHFLLTTPVRLGGPRQRWWVMSMAYAASTLAAAGWISGAAWARWLAIAWVSLALLSGLGVIVYVYARRATPDGRRRLRLIVLSTLFSGLPAVLLYFLPTLLGSTWFVPLPIVGLFTILAPGGYLLAAARHNLFGIDRLLNRALVYALLSLGILLLYLGPFVLIYRLLPNDWLAQVIVAAGLTLLVGLAFDWSRKQAQRLVDRIFYGGWYDYPAVVEIASEALSRSPDRQAVTQILTVQVPQLMQLGSCQLWVGGPKEPAPAPAAPPALSFDIPLQEPYRACWVVAPHQNGEDFSESDRRILNTLAQQAQVALENTLLVETLRRQIDEIRTSRDHLAQAQRQLLRSREEERTRLARELHDGPLQNLVGLNLQIGMLLRAPRMEEPVSQSLQAMRTEVRGLLSELRTLCAELRPPMLDALGLAAAVQALAEDWSAQNSIPVRLDLAEEPALCGISGEVAVNLYRIVQEALSNIAHHAQASQVHIGLRCEDGHLILSIQDNGNGFTPPQGTHQLAEQGHYGLVGMQERAALIGGLLEIRSAPGQGAHVCVSCPANQAAPPIP